MKTLNLCLYIFLKSYPKPVKAYCLMRGEDGGWTTILKRMKQDHQETFNRTLSEYEEGFGDPNTEYWLGIIIVLFHVFFNRE